MGISDATFHVRKKKYGGIGPSELQRLRQLEEENRKLKQIVAYLSLDKAMLRAVVAKKSEAFAPSRTRPQAHAAIWLQPAQRAESGVDVGIDLSVPFGGPRCDSTEAAHQGDHPDSCALRTDECT